MSAQSPRRTPGEIAEALADRPWQAIIEERWSCVTRDVRRIDDSRYPSPVNSERWDRVTDGLEEIATWLVGEVLGEDEEERLEATMTDLWNEIENRLIAFAESTEMARSRRLSSVA